MCANAHNLFLVHEINLAPGLGAVYKTAPGKPRLICSCIEYRITSTRNFTNEYEVNHIGSKKKTILDNATFAERNALTFAEKNVRFNICAKYNRTAMYTMICLNDKQAKKLYHFKISCCKTTIIEGYKTGKMRFT